MKLKLIFLFLVLVALGACRQTTKISETKIKKAISLMRPDTTTFIHTTDGKILKRISFSGKMEQSFSYENDRVVESGFGPMNNEPFTIAYYLNKKGQNEEMKRFTQRDTICLHFKYNSAGFREEEYLGCETQTLVKKRFFTESNLVKEILYSRGTEQQYVHYGYYTDKPNKCTLFGEEMVGFDFKGKDSKNLLKQMVLTNASGDTLFSNFFAYHFDDEGRVSLTAIYAKTGELIDSVAYYY